MRTSSKKFRGRVQGALAAGMVSFLLCVAGVACTGVSKPGSGGDDDRGEEDGEVPPPNDTKDLPPFEELPQIEVGEEFKCDRGRASAAPGQARRLTADELANAARDLFAVDIRDAARKTIPDAQPTLRDFNNQSLGISQQHIMAFEKLANDIVAAVNVGDLIGRHAASCSSFTNDCQTKFINGMGVQILRGPVIDAERLAFEKVYTAAKSKSYSFAEATKFVVAAMLQSPRFLYRLENETGDGGEVQLPPYAMASRLSFALWQSTPDEDLLAAAEANKLSSDADLGAQVRRMLEDPRAKTSAVTFLDDWMDLHRLDDGEELKTHNPNFNVALLKDMQDETRALFTRLLEQKLPLTSMFNTQTTTVSKRLAEHYQLPNPKDGVQEYDLTDVGPRGGLLTQGSMASLGGAEGSTVRAGLHIMHEVLCGEMASPPPGLNVTPTPAKPGESVRVSSETRTSNPSCGGCHQQFEPLVWGMVRYRGTGEYRDQDAHGNALPEDGWIIFPDNPEEKHSYETPAEMMSLLADSTRVRDCALLKTAQYLQARSLRESDGCYLNVARERLSPEASYQDMVQALALSPEFRRIRTVAP